ncbi:MAG: hypothetical protein HKO76_07110 [Acidimicrobiia bacterium]|nr:hypothetical protein [Acidimicrobiia bacterium]
MRLLGFAAVFSLMVVACAGQPETAPSTTDTTTTTTSETISTPAPVCADAHPAGSTTVLSSVRGSFDQTDEELEAAIARDQDGAWWLLIDGGPPRSLGAISFPAEAFETFADAPSFRIEFVADLTGDGVDELVVDPGLGNDQRLYPVQLTSCSGRTIPTVDEQPFFFEVASGFTYEASYACWSVEDSLGIVTTVATGPRDESGFIAGEVIQTGWRYDNGMMRSIDLAAATPVTVVCPGRP